MESGILSNAQYQKNLKGKEDDVLKESPRWQVFHVPMQTELEPGDYLLVQEKLLGSHDLANPLPSWQPIYKEKVKAREKKKLRLNFSVTVLWCHPVLQSFQKS
nr:hypothetical protein Iba_chr01fCG2500 [Ipomoea batatas]GME19223.1 hypothetical protein Iba_scaffold22200CG0030 [Ipomoea batatas]